MGGASGGRAEGCVVGDIDLVRPLALAGVPCTVMAPDGSPARYSRSARAAVGSASQWSGTADLVDRLVDYAGGQAQPPVLFVQTDADLLTVSRERDRLLEAMRFVMPAAETVEDLLDKGRAQALAERLALPIPPASIASPGAGEPPPDGLRYPLIAKPLLRSDLRAVTARGKAVRVENQGQLEELWERLAGAQRPILLQTLIPGPETAIESYHAYVDAGGTVRAEFTGRKLRTIPPEFGFTTAAETTDAADVRDLGRSVLERIGILGPVKVDFKRDGDGRLWLLEVNPRFNLWHHVGAVAGVNIPAHAYADCTAARPPRSARVAPGVRWVHPQHDYWARKEQGVPAFRWVGSVLGAKAKSGFAWDDPLPFVRGMAVPALRSRAAARRRRSAPAPRA